MVIKDISSDTPKKDIKPIGHILNYISFFMVLLAISSFVDGLVTWGQFWGRIILSYQGLIYPIYNFLFSWLPFQIPPKLIDYLNIGIVVNMSINRAFGFSLLRDLFDEKPLPWKFIGWVMFRLYVVMIVLWPGRFADIFIAGDKDYLVNDHGKKSWLWLSIFLVTFFVILIINYVERGVIGA